MKNSALRFNVQFQGLKSGEIISAAWSGKARV
jgi:hypothetical protein